jgi:hypothetical protein
VKDTASKRAREEEEKNREITGRLLAMGFGSGTRDDAGEEVEHDGDHGEHAARPRSWRRCRGSGFEILAEGDRSSSLTQPKRSRATEEHEDGAGKVGT